MAHRVHNDHLQYGWNKQNKRTSVSDKFWFEFTPCTREPMDFRSECIRAADLIYQSTDKKIVVQFSGGIDSELICLSLLAAGHPFHARICRFNNNLNEHDISYAINFCKKYNIEHSFFDFDMTNFLKSDCAPYRDIEFPNPFWSQNFDKVLMENGFGFQLFGEGHPLVGHDPLNTKGVLKNKTIHFPGEPLLPSSWNKERKVDDDVYLFMYEPIIETFTWMDEHNIDGCTQFYTYTPELFLAYILDSYFQDWLTYCQLDDLPNNRLYPSMGRMVTAEEYVTEKYKSGMDTGRFKINLKLKHFPEMKYRPKYTGMEYMYPLIGEYCRKMAKLHPADSPGNEVITFSYTNILSIM